MKNYIRVNFELIIDILTADSNLNEKVQSNSLFCKQWANQEVNELLKEFIHTNVLSFNDKQKSINNQILIKEIEIQMEMKQSKIIERNEIIVDTSKIIMLTNIYFSLVILN